MAGARVILEYVQILIWPTLAVIVLMVGMRLIRENTRKRAEQPALRAGIAWVGHDGTTSLAAALEDSEWLARLGGNPPPNPAVHLQQAVRINPSAYRESTREVVENLRAGRVVILDLAASEHETAARLIDFCSAFTLATRGLMQQLTSTVLVLTPPSSSAS